MAILVVSSRKFAELIERSCALHRSLKLRTLVKRLRHPKNAGSNHQVNLNRKDSMELTGLWFSAAYSVEDRTKQETLVELDALHTSAENASERVPPVIIYSMSEWKAIVEIGTGLTSMINLHATNANDPVFLNLKVLWPSVEEYVCSVIRNAYQPQNVAAPRILHDEIPQGGAAFGAVDASENAEETLPSIPEDSGVVDHH